MKQSKILILKLCAIIFIALVLAAASKAQNIINTVGSSGTFKIKDGASTFFTLTQSNGYVDLTKSLRLAVTTDINTGVIYKGTDRFMHDYKFASNYGNNLFVGINSGNFTLGSPNFGDGSINTGIGSNTLNSITLGKGNVAIGHNSMQFTTSGIYNVAIGPFSLESNTTGNFNTVIGAEAMSSNTTGIGNSALGSNALNSNTTGNQNIAIGGDALHFNTIGQYNVSIGSNSLYNNTNGYNNTAVGSGSLGSNNGNYNTAVGYFCGNSITTGSNLILLGNNAQPSTGTVSNQITIGNNFITSFRCNVQTLTSLSDARDKKNIKDLSLGLDFIMKIKPRQFNWDRRDWYDNNISDGSKTDSVYTSGFIAQELDEVQREYNAQWLKLVLKDNPEKWEATYGNLLPVMVKAIQDLKEENDKLKNEVKMLKSVDERLTKLEESVKEEKILNDIKTAVR